MKRARDEFENIDDEKSATTNKQEMSCIQNYQIVWKSDPYKIIQFSLSSVPKKMCALLATEIINNRAVLLVEKPPFICYGKPCRQQRDVGFFSDVVTKYTYSGKPFPAKPLTEMMRHLLVDVCQSLNGKWNGILVNVYDTGENYIGAHSDDEKELDKTAGVLTLSIGATRTFRIRKPKHQGGQKMIDIPLISTMFIQMVGPQSLFTHEIPIEKKVKGRRISFTFRCHQD